MAVPPLHELCLLKLASLVADTEAATFSLVDENSLASRHVCVLPSHMCEWLLEQLSSLSLPLLSILRWMRGSGLARTLEVVDLSGPSRRKCVGDGVAVAIARWAPQLIHLNLNACAGLSNVGAFALCVRNCFPFYALK